MAVSASRNGYVLTGTETNLATRPSVTRGPNFLCQERPAGAGCSVYSCNLREARRSVPVSPLMALSGEPNPVSRAHPGKRPSQPGYTEPNRRIAPGCCWLVHTDLHLVGVVAAVVDPEAIEDRLAYGQRGRE